MASSLKRISIEGFKSIRKLLNFELRPLNILVGANGAGKSNFVDFFRLLRAMADERLVSYVNENGKADSFLFNGPKVTDQIQAHFVFGYNEYTFTLRPTVTGEFNVFSEAVAYAENWKTLTSGAKESGLKTWEGEPSKWGPYSAAPHYVYESVSSWVVYHFHDTSATARMRRDQPFRHWDELEPDAGNISPFLHRLKQRQPERYAQVRYYIQLIAPFFDDFLLEPEQSGQDELIRLQWRQKGSSMPMQPHHFSDGTLRFICLTTALLQPDPPATIVIDEPELGLHPFALSVLASVLHEAASRTQLIVSTQSAPLLDSFEPDDIVIVDRDEGASRFRRLEAEKLEGWLEEYTLGQLWRKNVFEGGPRYE